MIGTLKAIAGLLMRGLLFPVFYGWTLSGWMGALRLGRRSLAGGRSLVRLEALNDPSETPVADLLLFKLLQQVRVLDWLRLWQSQQKTACFFGGGGSNLIFL